MNVTPSKLSLPRAAKTRGAKASKPNETVQNQAVNSTAINLIASAPPACNHCDEPDLCKESAPCPHITLADIANYFNDLPDPRCHVNRRHPLQSVVVVAIMGILAGANGPTAIARWAKAQKCWLLQTLDLPHGVPCKDVFRTVLALLNPALFQACFRQWLGSLKLNAMQVKNIEQLILSIDGKTLRRSHDNNNDLKALHSVTIWASELGLTLAQTACAEKSNEITAIPQALKLTDISGSIITIDAMGCQKAIAHQIVHGKADYILPVKGNQETLQNEVTKLIHKHLEEDSIEPHQQHIVTETAHGHQETRIYMQIPVPEDFTVANQWPGLKSIGAATRCYVDKNGAEVSDVRYFISSLDVDVQTFARATRSHWGIENACHWSLDMTFREDYSRIRGVNIRENFAFLSRLALSLLKQHPAPPGKKTNESISMKRQICGWDPNFLIQVLTGTRT